MRERGGRRQKRRGQEGKGEEGMGGKEKGPPLAYGNSWMRPQAVEGIKPDEVCCECSVGC